MTAFDQAWALLKSPFVTPFEDEVIDQPLYSGGDAGDNPLYWTKDQEEAMMYALYGSAVLNDTEPGNVHGYDRNFYPDEQDFDTFTPPLMRQTIPTIFRADPHPTLDERVELDPMADDRYRNYMSHDLAYDTLSDDDVARLINEHLEDYGGAGFTSGQYHPHENREAHVRAALERLKERQAGRLTLPEGKEGVYGWSETDEGE
jgi:alkanesulfonate monooxygenase SsuD/methylene tetrahydromethanopterin reductase-like flavin-dependent oxidoreductase (luciferase family)|tara:strand:+ start:61 stop:669 length:609 start_codon:yes stop_codon:yes gene_type:complete